MAKKWKFKLEALRRMREFKEKNLKIEVGKTIKKIQDHKDRIVELEGRLDVGYSDANEVARLADGRLMSFYPLFFEGIKADIEVNEKKIAEQEDIYAQQLVALQKARGETKVLEKMKERDYRDYRRELEKRQLNEIEELNNMVRIYKAKEAV